SAALSARLQELGCAPTDPRVAPMLAQVQALMREHLAGLQAAGNVAVLPLGSQTAAAAAPAGVPNGAVSYDLPEVAGPRLEAFAQTCLTFSPAHFTYRSLVLG